MKVLKAEAITKRTRLEIELIEKPLPVAYAQRDGLMCIKLKSSLITRGGGGERRVGEEIDGEGGSH